MKLIIVGCGHIGAELAQRLNAAGHAVTVIDSNREAFDRLGDGFHGRTIDGVGFDRGVLKRAGIEQADALAALTSDDSSNVIITSVARNRFHVPYVVARLYDPHHAPVYQALNIPTTSSVSWAVDQLEQLICCPEMGQVASLGNGQVAVVEVQVSAALSGKPLSSLDVTGEAIVVALTRGAITSLPTPGKVLQTGDLVYLSVAKHAVSSVHNRLASNGKGVP